MPAWRRGQGQALRVLRNLDPAGRGGTTDVSAPREMSLVSPREMTRTVTPGQSPPDCHPLPYTRQSRVVSAELPAGRAEAPPINGSVNAIGRRNNPTIAALRLRGRQRPDVARIKLQREKHLGFGIGIAHGYATLGTIGQSGRPGGSRCDRHRRAPRPDARPRWRPMG
jgi:hypothetical protein